MMYMYYNGLLNGFWAKRNDMRSGPMASPSSGPALDEKVGPMGHAVRLEFKA